MSESLTLMAPLTGWAMPLAETPDPVFAEKMLGDGVAIDPVVGELRAPAAGEIIGLHPCSHAVTIRADNGAEILLHVGLETVNCGGEGFEAVVALGPAGRGRRPVAALQPRHPGPPRRQPYLADRGDQQPQIQRSSPWRPAARSGSASRC